MARLVWVDRKFVLRDFDQTRAGGGGVDAYHVYVGGGAGKYCNWQCKSSKNKNT